MSGVGMMMLGSGATNILTATMTVGTGTYSPVSPTYYSDGFIGIGSSASKTYINTTGFIGIGSLTPTSYKGAVVNAIYWVSLSSHVASNGVTRIEFSGNRAAGFVTLVTSAGVSLGTVGAPSYSSGDDTTSFQLGTTSTNPFGTSGTKAIVVS